MILIEDEHVKLYINRMKILLEEDEAEESGDSSGDDFGMDDDSNDEETTHFDIKTKILLRQIKDTIDISEELSTYLTAVYGDEFIHITRKIMKTKSLFIIFVNNYNEYEDDDKSKILFKFRKIVENNLKQIQKIVKG